MSSPVLNSLKKKDSKKEYYVRNVKEQRITGYPPRTCSNVKAAALEQASRVERLWKTVILPLKRGLQQ